MESSAADDHVERVAELHPRRSGAQPLHVQRPADEADVARDELDEGGGRPGVRSGELEEARAPEHVDQELACRGPQARMRRGEGGDVGEARAVRAAVEGDLPRVSGATWPSVSGFWPD